MIKLVRKIMTRVGWSVAELTDEGGNVVQDTFLGKRRCVHVVWSCPRPSALCGGRRSFHAVWKCHSLFGSFVLGHAHASCLSCSSINRGPSHVVRTMTRTTRWEGHDPHRTRNLGDAEDVVPESSVLCEDHGMWRQEEDDLYRPQTHCIQKAGHLESEWQCLSRW